MGQGHMGQGHMGQGHMGNGVVRGMLRCLLALVCGSLLVLPGPPAVAQPTAEGDDLCGEPKAEPQALYERLAKDSRLREMRRSEHYVALENGRDGTLWTFTLPAHPAHPAAVCRRVMERRGIIDIPTTIVCHGSEGACATLKSDFEALNARMVDELYKTKR
jgi:hypothetical protein